MECLGYTFGAFTAFVAFLLRHSGWSFIYLFIFLVTWHVVFMVHWDGTSVAVTAFVVLMRRLGWGFGAGPCGIHSVCIV